MSQPTKGDYTKLSDSVRELSNYSAETRSDIGYLRQALADIRKDLDKEREQNSALRTQVAVLQASHDDFKKKVGRIRSSALDSLWRHACRIPHFLRQSHLALS